MSRYGMMTYVHNGHQYVMVQAGPKLIAMALPGAIPKASATGGGE
jgi:ribosomal protein S19